MRQINSTDLSRSTVVVLNRRRPALMIVMMMPTALVCCLRSALTSIVYHAACGRVVCVMSRIALPSSVGRVSQYQKGKTNLDFTEARDSEWQ